MVKHLKNIRMYLKQQDFFSYGVVVDKLSIISMANLRVLVLIERKREKEK